MGVTVDSHVARPDSRVSSAAYPRILGARGADAAEVSRTFRYGVSFCCRWSFLVVPIEASEFEVEFFLRGVECDTRFAKKRSWKLFFLFFSHSVVAFWEFGIWGKSFTSRAVEFLWLGACIGVGSRRVGVLGRKSCFGPLTPITLAALPLTPPILCAAPPIPLPSWPPPSHLLLSQALAATHQTLAPHLLLPWCHSLPLGSPSRGANLQRFSVEGGREEEKGENPRWFLCLSLVHFMRQSNCLDVACAIW